MLPLRSNQSSGLLFRLLGSSGQRFAGERCQAQMLFMAGDVTISRSNRQAISSHFELPERWDTSHWHGISVFRHSKQLGKVSLLACSCSVLRPLQGRSLGAAQGGVAGTPKLLVSEAPFRVPSGVIKHGWKIHDLDLLQYDLFSSVIFFLLNPP